MSKPFDPLVLTVFLETHEIPRRLQENAIECVHASEPWLGE